MSMADADGPDPRAAWRVGVATAAAVAIFVVVLAVMARATRDEAGAPVQPGTLARSAQPSEGGVGHQADAAGAGVDGGPEGPEGATVPLEPDAGPAAVAAPPVDLEEVRAALAPVMEQCLQGALRFDPSLGGRVEVVIDVQRDTLRARLRGAASPVLASCVEQGARAVAIRAPHDDVMVFLARASLDGLRGRVRFDSVEPLVQP